MCRTGTEPGCSGGARRCEGSSGGRRNAIDRARYAVKKTERVLVGAGGRMPARAIVDTSAPAELTLAEVLGRVDDAELGSAVEVTAADLDAIDAEIAEAEEELDWYAEEDEDDEAWGAGAVVAPVVDEVLTDPVSKQWIRTVDELFEELRRVGAGITLTGSWRRDNPAAAWEAYRPRVGNGIRRVTKSIAAGVELDSGETLALGKSAWAVESGLAVFETQGLRQTFALELAGRDAEAEAADAARFRDTRPESEAAVKGRAAILRENDAAVVAAVPLQKVLATYAASGHLRIDASRMLLEAEAVGGVSEAGYRAQRDVRYPELLAAEIATVEAWSTRLESGERAALKLAERVLPGAQLDAELQAWRDARVGVAGELRVLGERRAKAAASPVA